MRIDHRTHRIVGVCFIESPNYDDRPQGDQPDLIVVHNISLPPGEFENDYVPQFFTNTLDWNEHPYFQDLEGLKVSSHVYIRRNGQLIQFVPFDKRAWHAGQSQYCGRERCNDYSIGIELEGTDHIEFTSSQYLVLGSLIQSLMLHYPSLSKDHIVGHSDIAPQRKTDPGPYFDWSYLHKLLI